MSTRQATYRLMATGSTDAVGKAKQTARAEGLRIQTVASVRLGPNPPADTAREPGLWIVTLVVRA